VLPSHSSFESSAGILESLGSVKGLTADDDVKVVRYKAQAEVIERVSATEKKSLPRSLALSAGGPIALSLALHLID